MAAARTDSDHWIGSPGQRGYSVALDSNAYGAIAGSGGGFNDFAKSGLVFFRG